MYHINSKTNRINICRNLENCVEEQHFDTKPEVTKPQKVISDKRLIKEFGNIPVNYNPNSRVNTKIFTLMKKDKKSLLLLDKEKDLGRLSMEKEQRYEVLCIKLDFWLYVEKVYEKNKSKGYVISEIVDFHLLGISHLIKKYDKKVLESFYKRNHTHDALTSRAFNEIIFDLGGLIGN